MASAGVKTVMSNHFYTIGGIIRKQTDGGAIGSDMTGEMSCVYMLEWDDIFTRKCIDAGIPPDMYERYVDDETIISRVINKGWRFDKKSNRMKFSWQQWESDSDDDGEERTASILSDIANSINQSIQVTTDVPGRHSNKRMPVLDLELWVEDVNGIPQVCYSFYKKPVSSKYTILKRLAVSQGTKMNTLFQETIRRIMNISEYLLWSETVKHLNNWSQCMKISGYSTKERYNTIRGAIMRVEEMRKQVKNGVITSINRSKEEILLAKKQKGGITSATWFLKGTTAKVTKCQPTPGGTLAAKLKKSLNPEGSKERIQVVEEGGLPVSVGLRVNDPFHPGTWRYGHKECIVEKGKDCATMGILYEITCKSCNEVIEMNEGEQTSRQPGGQQGPNYVGMSMTSAHCRMHDHLAGQRQRKENNPLNRHDKESHDGEQQQYNTRILTRERNLLPLTIIEGLYIERQQSGTSFNDRNEYGRGNLIRFTASRGLT